MKVLVMSDAHILFDENDESYWCASAVHGYDFWERYLQVFDEVHVVARVKHLREMDRTKNIRADGEGVSFIELPFIRGAKEYIVNYYKLNRIMSGIISDEDCAIFRLPSLPTFMLLKKWRKTRRPYAIEVIYDPKEGYKDNFIAQLILTRDLKRECLRANGVSYVTQNSLQQDYPSKSILEGECKEFFDSFYSSIKLDKDFYYNTREYKGFNKQPIRIIHVSSVINSDMKGHITLLKVIKRLKEMSVPITLTVVGDGSRLKYYESISKKYDIENYVAFVGLLSKKDELRELLIQSDIMVFPTRAEGLPRVLIEAMSVGLPCLSTPVNGIPELLPPQYLFDPFDVEGFATKIRELYYNSSELNMMSNENYKRSLDYEYSVLSVRRNEFYKKLYDLSDHTF